MAILDGLTDLIYRLFRGANDPVAVVVELVLIALALNWVAGKLEGTRGTRPLRKLFLLFLIVTLGVRLMKEQFGWDRLEILYYFFALAVGFIALAAFQPELRRAFIRVGDIRTRRSATPYSRMINTLVSSAGFLSRNKYGALVALKRSVDLRGWAENGTMINAEVSANLLNTIFFPNSALHDLGIIVQDGRILAANCQFPSVENDEADSALGSRHLAAIGMSYETDALVLVVSEETGAISIADNGKLHRFLSLDDLEHELTARLDGSDSSGNYGRGQKTFLSSVWYGIRRTLVVAPLTVAVWYLADQATQVEADNVSIGLQPVSDPNFVTSIIAPQPAVFNVDLRGAKRSVDALMDNARDGRVTLNWQVSERSTGPHTLSVAGILDNHPRMRELGLVMREVEPAEIQFDVDVLIRRTVPVEADTGEILTGDPQITPATIEVTLPRQAWDALAEDQRKIRVPLATRLADVAPGATATLREVPVQRTLGGVPLVQVSQPTVDVVVDVVALTQEFELSNIKVDMLMPIGFHRELQQSNLELEIVDQQEWLLSETKFRSEDRERAKLEAEDVRAWVRLTDALLANPNIERTLTVQFSLPPGVTLTSPPPQVRVRIVQKGAEQ